MGGSIRSWGDNVVVEAQQANTAFKGQLSDSTSGTVLVVDRPRAGNYGGLAYTVGPLLPIEGELSQESETSGLVARRGGLLLDWLRCVLPAERRIWDELPGWLGPMTAQVGGWHGWYDRKVTVGDKGIIAYCSDRQAAEREGILVDLSGRACGGMGDKLIPFLSWCLENGHVTRVDFALDDYSADGDGLLTRERVIGSVDSGNVVCRFKKRPKIEDVGLGTWTQYLGNPRGTGRACLIRIYNKQAEQAGKGNVVPGHWVRCELQSSGKFADSLCRAYFEHGSTAVVGQIARRIRFIVPGNDGNKRRAATSPWWVAFLGSVEPGPSLKAGEVPDCTISRIAAFVEHECGPALCTLIKADGGDLGRLLDIIGRSEYRLKAKHHNALRLAGSTGVQS